MSNINRYMAYFTFRIEWPALVAAAKRDLKKPHTPDQLPTEEDISLFNNFLNTTMKENFGKALSELSAFRELQQSTLSYIILFNKRRSGEVSKAKLQMYRDLKDDIWKNKQEIDSLDDVMKSIANGMHLCYIMGSYTT